MIERSLRIVLLLIVFLIAGKAGAATRTASVSGNWNSTATWNGLSIPAVTDTVTMAGGIVVSVPSGYTATCGKVSFPTTVANSEALLSLADETAGLVVTGDVNLARPTTGGTNTINVGAGTLSAGTITLMGSTAGSRYTKLLISSGTATVTGSVTSAGAASIVLCSGAGTLTVGGGVFLSSTAAFTPGASTVNLNGSGDQAFGPVACNTLILSGSGAKSLAGAVTVGNNLTVSGSARLVNQTALVVSNLFTYASSGTSTLTGNLSGGAFTLDAPGGTLDLGTNLIHTFTGTWTRTAGVLNGGSSRLKLGAGVSGTGGTFIAAAGTVDWYAAGPQDLAGIAYSNLVLSGSGIKSIPAGSSVAGQLTIASTGSAVADLEDGLNLAVGSLSLGGLGRINGTWGSSSAAGAANKNDVFFAPSTGFLTVTTDTRTSPLVTWPSASSITTNQTLGASVLTGGSATNSLGAAIPGIFAFESPDVLPQAGATNAPALFVPADSNTYTTATGTIRVQVATLATYYVDPSGSSTPPYDTWGKAATDIQTAVNKASADLIPTTNDCLVLVADGSYALTSQILITNGITLRSMNGRDATFLDGGYPAFSNRCVEIRNAPTAPTIDGFTLTNGYAWLQLAGGALYITNSPAVIRNCSIAGNRSTHSVTNAAYGGGIGIIATNRLMMSNCWVSANVLANGTVAGNVGVGGAMYAIGPVGLIVDCQFVNHMTSNNITAGGVYVSGGASRLTLLRCLIQNNYSDRYSGGVSVAGFTTLDNCVINSNTAKSATGGLKCDSDSVIVTNCVISRNRSGPEGIGGVSWTRGITLVNSLIVGNSTGDEGGGVVGDRTIRNCLIAANQADGLGGGVYRTASAGPLVNCTVVRNSSLTGGGGIYTLPGITNVALNTIVAHNEGGLIENIAGVKFGYSNSCSPDLAGIAGNAATDPLFINPGSGYGTNAVLGDYHLQAGSPAIDAGSPSAPPRDLDGVLRPIDGNGDGIAVSDMGVYEAPMVTSGAFRCSFSTPTNIAVESLSAAFTASVGGPATNGLSYQWTFGDGTTSAWSSGAGQVAHLYSHGTFAVSLSVSNDLGQTASYTRPGFITVYPAYVYVATNGSHSAPFGTWSTAATNIQSAVNAAAEGQGYTLAVLVSNGVYTVNSEITINNPVTLRSFSGNRMNTVIQGGYPASSNRCLNLNHSGAVVDGFTISNGYLAVNDNGAGVFMVGGTVRNCLITRNSLMFAGGYGAGVCINGGLMTNCVISQNKNSQSSGMAGGVYAIGGGILANCVIVSNSSKYVGGLYLNGGNAVARNCEIAYNIGTTVGGVQTLFGALEGCLVIGNESTLAAATVAGVYAARSSDYVQNCTIVGNKALTFDLNGGGGLSLLVGYTPSAVNTIVWGNQAGGVPSNIGGYTNKVSYSCGSELQNGVSNNVNTQPQFLNPGSGYGTNYVRGNYHLVEGSPCLDSGTVVAGMAEAVDLEGAPRVQGAAPNMGALESVLKVSKGAVLLIR